MFGLVFAVIVLAGFVALIFGTTAGGYAVCALGIGAVFLWVYRPDMFVAKPTRKKW